MINKNYLYQNYIAKYTNLKVFGSQVFILTNFHQLSSAGFSSSAIL